MTQPQQACSHALTAASHASTACSAASSTSFMSCTARLHRLCTGSQPQTGASKRRMRWLNQSQLTSEGESFSGTSTTGLRATALVLVSDREGAGFDRTALGERAWREWDGVIR